MFQQFKCGALVPCLKFFIIEFPISQTQGVLNAHYT